MSDVVFLNLVVSNPEEVVQEFDKVKVYRCIYGTQGPWTEITSPTTRIPLSAEVVIYPFEDPQGAATYYYSMSYFNSSTLLESSKSDPQQGQGDAALSVISVADLKANYLFGIDLTDPKGNPMPDTLFQFYIKAAVSWVEKRLDMAIRPTAVVNEKHNYYPRDYENYCYIQLKKTPCVSVQQMRMVFPGTGNDPNYNVIDPCSIDLDTETGVVQVLPNRYGSGGFPLIGINNVGFPGSMIGGNQGYVPNVFRIDYTAGFTPGNVPYELVEVIAKIASYGPLNIAGDLLGGAGVASFSLSLDGISQNINTTSSPMFSGFGARLNIYQKEVAEQLPLLRKTYKGIPMVVA